MEVPHDLQSVLVQFVSFVEEVDSGLHLVDVVRRDHAVDPETQGGVSLAQRGQVLDRRTKVREGLVLPADRIVGVFKTVHGEVQRECYPGALLEEGGTDLLGSFEVPPIRWDGDRGDAVIADKGQHDLVEAASQEGFSAGEEQATELGHCLADLEHALERDVACLVQVVRVAAESTTKVASIGDKEDQRVQFGLIEDATHFTCDAANLRYEPRHAFDSNLECTIGSR